MNITPYHDEPGRYLVDSRTPGEPPYLVDVNENGGQGACSCQIVHCRHTSGCVHLAAVKEKLDTDGHGWTQI